MFLNAACFWSQQLVFVIFSFSFSSKFFRFLFLFFIPTDVFLFLQDSTLNENLLNCLHPLGILLRGRPNPLRSWEGPQRAWIQFLNYQKSGSIRCRCPPPLDRKFSFKVESCKNEKTSMGMKNRNKNIKNLVKNENEKLQKLTKTHCWDRKHAAFRNILRTT